MKTTEIIEGKTKLLIPSKRTISKKDIVFYNPDMKLSRDISVLVAKAIKPKKFCDLFAGTGARGIRIANETGMNNILLNDKNPEAFKLMKKNVEINGLDLIIKNSDANSILNEDSFDFIDIDPFGSPVTFIDSAIMALKNNGILAVTATDTSALCGTYPRACRRKYDSTPLRTEYYNELGLRIFLGYIIRSGLKHNLSFTPLFSHCTRHYFRVYLRGEKSRRKCNEAAKKIKFLQHCFRCLNRVFSDLNNLKEKCRCGFRFSNAGPLWSEKFADTTFCKKLEKNIDNQSNQRDILKIIGIIRKEQKIKNPYYNLHRIFQKRGIPAKPTEYIVDNLRANGFYVSKTHFSALGIRSNADVFQLYDIPPLRRIRKYKNKDIV